jgi:hypothetical protein
VKNKNVVASSAFIKYQCAVPNQDWEEITELFTKHFMSIAPGVTVKVKPHHGGQGYVTPIDKIGYKAAIWLIQNFWSSSYSGTFWR